MRPYILAGFARSENAAVAPIVALSLFGLIAVGGIAFDYARLATMDTELQTAADQAALAAASQLDGQPGACSRAAHAAQSLVSNQSRFANDGSGLAVTIVSAADDETACDTSNNIKFWKLQDRSVAASTDSDAHFVQVTVNSREAFYALTPVVGAFRSGAITATAYAGLGSAVCQVPPLMVCSPDGTANFDPDANVGKGLRLVETQGAGAAYAAGAFGYLNVGAANNGSPDQRAALGFNRTALPCQNAVSGDIDTGVSSSIVDALNVRFDIFQNGWASNTCFGSNNCSSSMNNTKDVVRRTSTCTSATAGVANNTNSDSWVLPSDADQYVPSNAAGDDSSVTHMGYPMDICHYATVNSCGRLGNGTWRPDIYFKVNHPNLVNSTGSNWSSVTGLPSNASRYRVYQWELSTNNVPNAPNPPVKAFTTGSNGNGNGNGNGGGGGGSSYGQYGAPLCKAGIAAGGNQPDRRVVSVAVVSNCGSLHGSSVPANISTWMDVFLVQPALARSAAGTAANELYVEIIGRSKDSGTGNSGAQVVRRDAPYLIE